MDKPASTIALASQTILCHTDALDATCFMRSGTVTDDSDRGSDMACKNS